MTPMPIVIVGAGGHGRSVADALLLAGCQILGFVDPMVSGQVDGLPVLGADDWLDADAGYRLANGLGGTGTNGGARARRRLQTRLEALGFVFAQVIHPSAIISRQATISPGAQVLARAVVQPGAVLGAGAIVNTGAILEHGVQIGDFTHCATGSILCGDVRIGAEAHIGAGAVIRQGVALENGVVVGAGAVVLTAGTEPGALIGVPARRRRPT